MTEREHGVPLVHGNPQCCRISVFTRKVAAPDGCDRSCPVDLQGGPGPVPSRFAVMNKSFLASSIWLGDRFRRRRKAFAGQQPGIDSASVVRCAVSG